MRFILIFTFFNICSPLFAQSEFGVKLNLGISRVIAKFDYQTGSQKFPIMPSGNLGLFYSKSFTANSIIGMELFFQQIEGKEKYIYPDGSKLITRRNLSYIGVPIYYGFRKDDLILNIGLQFSYNILKFEQLKGQVDSLQENLFNWTTSIPNIDKYDIGIKVGLIHKINSKLNLDVNYYHGINNIWKSDPAHQGNWKVQQLTLGLRYRLNVIN